MLKIHVLPLTYKIPVIELLQVLDPAQQERVLGFVSMENAHMTLWGDLLVRSLIAPMLMVPCGELRFKRNAYGKPMLTGRNDIHFNVSHSGGLVVCAIDLYPVGVDIEEVLPIDYELIARRYFAEEEIEYLKAKPSAERLSCFYEIWTMKESYAKAVGQGLSLQLRDFSVFEPQLSGYRFRSFNKHPYKMSVCSLNQKLPDRWIPETEDAVLKRLRDNQFISGGMLNV